MPMPTYKIQIKGTSAEVVLAELDDEFVKGRKKWFADQEPSWNSLDSAGHVSGVDLGQSARILLFDNGIEWMSFSAYRNFDKGSYAYSSLAKRPSQAGKTACTAVQYAKGIVFDSGDFESSKEFNFDLYTFEMTRVLAKDSAKGTMLDLELITGISFDGKKLANIAQPEKKSPKIYQDRFDPADASDFPEASFTPTWVIKAQEMKGR